MGLPTRSAAEMRFDRSGLLTRGIVLLLLLDLVTVKAQGPLCANTPDTFAKTYKMQVLSSKNNGVVMFTDDKGESKNAFNPPNANIYTTFLDKVGTYGIFYQHDDGSPAFQSSKNPGNRVDFPANTPLMDWKLSFIDMVNSKLLIVTPTGTFELSPDHSTIMASTETSQCQPAANERCLYDPAAQKAKSVRSDWIYQYCGLYIFEKPNEGKLVLSSGPLEVCLGKMSDYKSVAVALPANDIALSAAAGCDTEMNLNSRRPTTVAPTKPTTVKTTHASTEEAGKEEFTAAPMECKGFGPFDGWIPCSIVYVLLVLVLGAGAGMVVIERKGRHKKAAYLRMQKLLKKNEEPSGITQTQTEGDADPKSGQNKSKQKDKE